MRHAHLRRDDKSLVKGLYMHFLSSGELKLAWNVGILRAPFKHVAYFHSSYTHSKADRSAIPCHLPHDHRYCLNAINLQAACCALTSFSFLAKSSRIFRRFSSCLEYRASRSNLALRERNGSSSFFKNTLQRQTPCKGKQTLFQPSSECK